MSDQRHEPNPSVNREKRPQILAKHIRSLENKNLKPSDKRYRRLQNYKAELERLTK